MAEIAALLRTALAETYGLDISIEALADSFYYLNRVRRLFASRHGVRKGLFFVIETFWHGRGFLTEHVTPRALRLDLPDDWTDPVTGEARHDGVFALLKQAEQRSATYMQAALANWMDKLPDADLAEVLGSMDYTTGTPTERSLRPAVPDDTTEKETTT